MELTIAGRFPVFFGRWGAFRRCSIWWRITGSVNMRRELRQDRFDDVAGDAGQADVEALELEREALVIDTEQMEHGGVKIVDADGVFFGRIPEFIGCSVSHAAADSAAGGHV